MAGRSRMARKPSAGSLTANDIFKELYGSSNSSLVFTGLIDKSDDDQSILFTRGPDCGEWKKIPASTIEKVQFVQTVACKDHIHTLVHLFLKEPQSPEGRAFAAVAHAYPRAAADRFGSTQAPSVPSVLAQQGPSGVSAPAGPVPCPHGGQWVYDIGTGQWIWRCYPA